jgi:hypothetical protein
MELHHPAVETLGDRRHKRNLEGTGGDNDLIGLVATVVELDEIGAAGLPDRLTPLFSSTGRSKRRA